MSEKRKSLDDLIAELDEAEAAIKAQHRKVLEWKRLPHLYMDPVFAWKQVLVTARRYRRAIEAQREIIDLLGNHIMREE